MTNWFERFKSARRVGTPILALESADQIESARLIAQDSRDPVIWWDCAGGPRAMNEPARQPCSQVFADPFAAINLVEALKMAQRLPEGSVLLVALAHRLVETPDVVQSILNLRDPFKQAGASLVLLLPPGGRLPSELTQDVLTVERPLPVPEEILPVVRAIAEAASEQLGKPMPSEAEMKAAAEALVGLSEFAAESACSLAVDDGGLVPESLWQRKQTLINQTPGLRLVPPSEETFDKVGGMEAIRKFSERLFAGKAPPKVIIWVDEIEKAIAGSGGASGVGDTSGTSQDQLQVLLNVMVENDWTGMILLGPPGSGKSMTAKAMGASNRVPTIMLDLGAMKGSLVGQSEQRIRAAMRIVKALAGANAFWVATCNRFDSIPTELRRRFTAGIWFADLPTQAEREDIWKIHLKANGVGKNQSAALHAVREWSGAEIRNCCRLAAQLGIDVADATSYIVPVSQSDPDGIERLRRAADGRFLSVSAPGPYVHPGNRQDRPEARPGTRKMVAKG